MSHAPPPPPYSERESLSTTMAQPGYGVTMMPIVGEYPVQCTCPQCHKQIVTRTEKKVGMFAWLLCVIMFFFGFWCCCFIPFCVGACKDSEHYCPSCNTLLGVSKKL